MRIIIWCGPVTTMLVLKLGLFLLLFTRVVVCQYATEITWTISKTSSCEDQQQLGCRCETSQLKPKPTTEITCSCEHQSQVAHLQGSRDKTVTYAHEIVWTIENCTNITVHDKVLPHAEGADFKLQFVNISALEIKEDAFENIFRSTSSTNQDKSIKFSTCKIESIPSRAFPSNLERIEFDDCEIGTIKSNSFKQLYMKEMIFKDTTIEDIQPNAFYQDLVYWIATNSRFKRIQTNSITGGIRHMNWSMCIIDNLETNSIDAVIGHSLFEESHFYRVEPNGLTIQGWTSLSLINNTFHQVNNSAIDLTQRSDTAALAVIKGNVWHNPSPNFIITGQVNSTIAVVENNTFMEICECGKTFTPLISLEGSKQWFVREVLKNSRCPITERATACLERNETFLFFDELDLLCEEYACTQDMQSVSEIFTPQLPDRLRILAIFIGTLAGAIVLSLLVTMCVFLLRKQKKTTKRNETSDITKSLGGPQQDFADVVYKMSQAPPLHRPRSTLFEDVEMEDKGVQTMPNELSTDVLEGLREKLSRPDSFWDAKETIDHLYGLIQVREQSTSTVALSSPPDVTMCNNDTGTSTSPATATNNKKNNSPVSPAPTTSPPFPPLPATKAPTTSLANNARNNTRYAQILNKPKTATLCEYRDPSDSLVHIYSELSHQNPIQRPRVSNAKIPTIPPHPRTLALPVLCEYNEPKDVQTHVYAELTNRQQLKSPAKTEVKSFMDNENQQPSNPNTGTNSNNIPVRPSNIFLSPTVTPQRPLPDIPAFSSPVQ